MLTRLKKQFQPQINTAKNLINDLKDLRDKLTGRHDPMVPPRRMIFVGAGDYKKVGQAFLKTFIEIGGLKPTDNVLDVGSGIGRMAVPLTGYLSPQAKYEGFDIVKEGVDWCNKNITAKFPNFRFQHANIYNTRYNTGGTVQPHEFTFPYPDKSFDFIFLTSVFTHMMTEEMDRYLAEISRVLRDGGTCLITFFLLNDKSRSGIAAGKAVFTFPYRYDDNCFLDHQEIPESAVAYKEEFVKASYPKHRLAIKGDVHYGSWSGREDHYSFQDIIVAGKH